MHFVGDHLEANHLREQKSKFIGIMDKACSSEKDALFDLETGMSPPVKEQEETKHIGCSSGQDNCVLTRVWSSFVGVDGSIKTIEGGLRLEGNASSSLVVPLTYGEALMGRNTGDEGKAEVFEKKVAAEKPKKKGCKKHPKPPRPPNSRPIAAFNQQLMKEMCEIEMLKQERIERMKKMIKNSQPTHYYSNFWTLLISIVFILIVLWQGLISRASPNVGFHGSPESSVQTRGGLISIRFYKNTSRKAPEIVSSPSPGGHVSQCCSLSAAMLIDYLGEMNKNFIV